jgi:hypothetical protein
VAGHLSPIGEWPAIYPPSASGGHCDSFAGRSGGRMVNPGSLH